jgi:phosphoglycerate dehydrogenase-like enzyme
MAGKSPQRKADSMPPRRSTRNPGRGACAAPVEFVAERLLLAIAPPGHPALRLLEPLRSLTHIEISNAQSELERLAPEADVILYSGIESAALDWPRLWERACAVRWIHALFAGMESLLLPGVIASAVAVTNARGVFKRSLAEFAVLGILFHTKRVRRLIDNQRERKWDDFTVDFADRRVMGIVGYGEIGRECALLARALGLEIWAIRRHPEKSARDPLLARIFAPQELNDMLKSIDVLLCAAPLTAQTHHMIGDAEFAAMRPHALIINVGRGPVIDEGALVRALESGRIAGASLDVFEREPLPQDSVLWALPNVLISPHCTDRTRDPDHVDLSMQVFVENFRRFHSGEALHNLVDKRAGY